VRRKLNELHSQLHPKAKDFSKAEKQLAKEIVEKFGGSYGPHEPTPSELIWARRVLGA
jgi:hypothetical protein